MTMNFLFFNQVQLVLSTQQVNFFSPSDLKNKVHSYGGKLADEPHPLNCSGGSARRKCAVAAADLKESEKNPAVVLPILSHGSSIKQPKITKLLCVCVCACVYDKVCDCPTAFQRLAVVLADRIRQVTFSSCGGSAERRD